MDKPLSFNNHCSCNNDSSSESEEGINLLDVLRDNLKQTTEQRQKLQLANDRLHHILLDTLQIFTGAEEQVTCRSRACVVNDKSGDDASGNQAARGGSSSQETGLLESCVAEKASLEDALQEKDEREQMLLKELQSTQTELQDLCHDRALLQRQRDVLSAGLGDVEKALLEHVDMQRQAEKEREQQHRTMTEELQERIHTLEKQLKNHQAELECLVGEREDLNQLLLFQSEQYVHQEGRQALLDQKVAELRARVQELEDEEGAHQTICNDLELRVRRAEEGKEEAQTELAQLAEEVQKQTEERERLEVLVATLYDEVRRGRAKIAALVEGKKELKKREGRLHEITVRLEQEVKAISDQTQELSGQLEQREAQEEVLMFVQETLTKACAALRDKDEELALLKDENGALRAELAAVKEGRSTSTEQQQNNGQSENLNVTPLHFPLSYCSPVSITQLPSVPHSCTVKPRISNFLSVQELEKLLQQEQTLLRNLEYSLDEEQAQRTEQSLQLETERKAVLDLKVEVEEKDKMLHLANKSQEELQSQIHTLRLKLNNKEREHHVCATSVEREQGRVTQLQEELHHERLYNQALEQCNRAKDSLYESLSTQLEQERSIVCSLRSELQVTQSCYEALLAQERERTDQALWWLEEERSCVTVLSAALSRQAQEHVHHLEEEARAWELARVHERKFIQELRLQLDQASDLVSTVDRLRGQQLQDKCTGSKTRNHLPPRTVAHLERDLRKPHCTEKLAQQQEKAALYKGLS